ncbi:MAG: insulinase family protein [Clostridia bacterium]|nr:insulinase family protein [Clostridia bacterium]
MKEEKRILKNKIPMYSLRNPSSHGFFISLFLKAGAMYERPDEAGITHFLEHITIRNINAAMRGGLYPLLDKNGIEFNASTFSEMVQFYVAGASSNFDIGADIISKIASPITLTTAEISTERGRIKAEIRENDEKNSLLGFTNGIVNEGTPLSGSITGTLSSVSGINRTRLEEYRKRVFTPENLFLYVTGNFTDESLSRLSELVGSWELSDGEVHDNIAPVCRAFGNRALTSHVKGGDFTMVRFNFDMDMSILSMAETDLLYDILFGGYSSRFFVEMSEKRGFVYDISGNVERYKNIGSFAFSFEIRSDLLLEAIELALDLLYGITRETLDDSMCMKAGYVKNGSLLADDQRELNFTFAYDNHIMDEGYSTLEERASRYERVTPDDIRSVAKRLFAPENMTLAVKGNKKRINKSEIDNLILNYKKRFYD